MMMGGNGFDDDDDDDTSATTVTVFLALLLCDVMWNCDVTFFFVWVSVRRPPVRAGVGERKRGLCLYPAVLSRTPRARPVLDGRDQPPQLFFFFLKKMQF